MKRLLPGLMLLLAWAGPAWARPAFPEGVEEPLQVQAAVQILEIEGILDSQERFLATVDVRLTWVDPRQTFRTGPDEEARVELNGEAARVRLREMWVPEVRLNNLVGRVEDQVSEEGLVLDGDGHVQWFRRLEAGFKTHLDHGAFPFERQVLPVELVCAQEDVQRLVLTYGSNLRDISNMQASDPIGWHLSRLHVRPQTIRSWSGTTRSALTMEVEATREPRALFDSLFLPLLVTALIPMLALMMNHWNGRRLVVEPFELAKLVLAGLFATITLNLATNSAYPHLLASYNLVSELFILDYLIQALALGVIVTFYRDQVRPDPRVDPYLARELYLACCWVVPLAALVTVIALIVRRL